MQTAEYPGSWDGEIEILTPMQDGWILAARVWEKDLAPNGEEASFHVVSFVHMQGEKISRIDEYWGDDGKTPQWRLIKRLGHRFDRTFKKINQKSQRGEK